MDLFRALYSSWPFGFDAAMLNGILADARRRNARDLARFSMAIDSKLRGCDRVYFRVLDIFAAGCVRERAWMIRSKMFTGNPEVNPPSGLREVGFYRPIYFFLSAQPSVLGLSDLVEGFESIVLRAMI